MATKHYLLTGTQHNIRQFKKDYPKGMIVEDNQTTLHVKRTKHYLMDKLCKQFNLRAREIKIGK